MAFSFYKHVLNKDWKRVDIVKPPQQKVLPNILSLKEIERLINGTRELRYQTFILAAFSMVLRIHEALNLKVGDIDAERSKFHIRQGKGKKDRFLTLLDLALQALRRYWCSHKTPTYKNIVDDNSSQVTFQYQNSATGKMETRQLAGEEFMQLVLQHTLPKGLRRARD